MALQQSVLQTLINLAVLATLAGLVMRDRARHCLSFVAYLSALFACETLVIVRPADFFTPEFWMVKQALYDVLRTLVALEMAWRVMRAFPGALRMARVSALVLLVGATVVLAGGPHRARYDVFFTWQPRVVACAAMLFGLTALLVAWYHLPIRAMHRAIMGGFAVYCAFFVTVLGLLQRWGWKISPLTSAVDSLALLGVSVWWARTAWLREEEAMPDIQELGGGAAGARAMEKAA
ncbi:MAG: hypothetical protein ABW221_15055 [Vicinamibacteria bacterium]